MCIFLILYHIKEPTESRNGLFRVAEHTFPVYDTCFIRLWKSPFQVVKQAFLYDVSACVAARNCVRRCLIDIYLPLQKLAYLHSYRLLSANIRSILHCYEYLCSPQYGFAHNHSVMYSAVLRVVMTCRHQESRSVIRMRYNNVSSKKKRLPGMGSLIGMSVSDNCNYSPFIAATPGRTFPSIASSIAPPPVET